MRNQSDVDAAVLLRSRVRTMSPWPTQADCVLLNAALHVEGRRVEFRSALCDERMGLRTCGHCGAQHSATSSCDCFDNWSE